MKRAFLAVLVAAMLLMMAGCEGALVSSGTTFMCVSTETSESFSMDYEQFNGSKQYRLKTRQDGTTVRVDVETESGTLSVKVTAAGSKDELVYSADDLQTGSFTFHVPEAGKYTVTVTADKHSGSFSFDWSN